MTSTLGLIGHTGFVGGALRRHRTFTACYNSSNIGEIRGRRFDVLVCAGAPATMWAANNAPEQDQANLERLLDAASEASVGTFILISTVAVFDDPGAGYTEQSARYESVKAYGRNRRWLETKARTRFKDARVVRLPALFGKGLKKNFIFDLLNPAPSFLRPTAYDDALSRLKGLQADLLSDAYIFEADLGMWRLLRSELADSLRSRELEEALASIGVHARNFTNSASEYQFYNIERLADDLDRCLEHNIETLNICTAPLRANAIHEALLGESFENEQVPKVLEDVRSTHAALLQGQGPYLYSAETVLTELRAFYDEARAA